MVFFGKKEKSIYEHRILERYIQGVDGCLLIGETEEYNIYAYRKRLLGNTHLLRQEKRNPKKVVYLGMAYHNIAIYHDMVFSIDYFSSENQPYHPLF